MSPCSSVIFSFLVAIIAREISRALITPYVNMPCLLPMSLIAVTILGAIATLWLCSRLRISVVTSASCPPGISRKRRGVGVLMGVGGPLAWKRFVLRGLVAGVVKMSSSLFADMGVGHAVNPSLVISSWRRFPGVENISVFWALRGVSGGGMVFFVMAVSVTFESSSSSLGSQS